MNLVGISSGIDYDQLITRLMEVERRPLLKMMTRKADLTTLQAVWQDIKSQVQSLRDAAATLGRAGFLEKLRATVSDTSILTATAGQGATRTTYEVVVKRLAQAHKVRSSTLVGEVGVAGTLRISGDGGAHQVSVTVEATMTLADIAAEINNRFTELRRDTAETFPFVEARVIADTLVLVRSETGEAQIQLSDDGTGLLNGLGFLDGTGQLRTLVAAAKSLLEIDGISYEDDRNTVSGAVQGLTFTLQKADETTTVRVTVDRDRSAIESNVRSFVDAYNALVGNLAHHTGKDGKLRGDHLARNLDDTLRRLIFSRVEVRPGQYRTVHDLGIQGESDLSGRISFDASVFWTAVDEDPAAVRHILDGVLNTLTARLDGFVSSNGFLDHRQAFLGRVSEDLDASIARMEKRLQRQEEQLRQRFLTLEKLLSEMDTQSTWLTHQVKQLETFRRK